MTIRLSRRELLASAGAWALLSRAPLGFALGPSPSTATPAFIDDLIARMTVDEKVGQLTLFTSAIQGAAAAAVNPLTARPTAEGQLAAARAGRLTGIFNGSDPRWHLRLQQAAMASRLKIPVIIAADVIHGFSTVFPVPLAETASFEPDLARRTARAAALEATAVGIDWTFAPMVDVARDARWGRMVEGAGEDVLVGRRFAAARVQGFQGDGLDRPDAMLACPKHFAAYGAAEAGLDYSTVDVSERTLREVYFPPFQSGFDAGALSTMAAFNELSGIPATANPWLLDEVLRGEWNFRGLVVSDYTADWELIAHGIAADEREAAKLAFLAGVDISMQSGLYLKHLPGLVADGSVPMAKLDESVRRVLRVKAALGLFDDPYRRLAPAGAARQQRRPDTLALARESARRSIVLLRNEGDVLPLRRRGQRVALIGPMAEDATNPSGPWAIFDGGDARNTFAEGMRQAMAGAGDLKVVAGCGFAESLPGGLQAAVEAAVASDVAVLVVGEPRAWSGEANSRTEIVLPAAQQSLIAAVATTGVPMVVVLSTGRALALDDAVLAAPAIVVSWFLGSASGVALADVLFGDYSPSARLPVSFPRESGQEPFHYDRKRTGRPAPPNDPLEDFKAHYRSVTNGARFAFGHGLTYGRIEYVGLETGGGTLRADGALEITARVRNGGARAAEEVVQLYVRDRAASVTRPIRELKDFRKVAIAPGETATVRFTLKRDDLTFIGRDLKPTVEPGLFDLWVAPSAEAAGLAGSFELLG